MTINLKSSDKVEITVVTDNYTDITLIELTENVKRILPLLSNNNLLAEHGLSFYITVYSEGKKHNVLFDAGLSDIATLNNMEILGINPGDIDAVFLSHGHFDHFGSLYKISRLVPEETPLIVHPEAFIEKRWVEAPNLPKLYFPRLYEDKISDNIKIVKSRNPHLFLSGLASSTGEIDRITDFEKGFPFFYREKNGEKELDKVIDEHALIFNVKDKGLVIISGCSHPGIINTILHAKKITGIEYVYAVIGGFHLTGPIFEPIVGRTIEEMKKINPKYIVPLHCTGWKATVEFSRDMPEQFILSTVGTKFIF